MMQLIISIRKKMHKSVLFLTFASFIVFSLFSFKFPIISLGGINQKILDHPNTSVVAGSEMYSEQLSVYIAGDTSIIKQGYITNDSNILNGFNYDDPAFQECSVLIASSNGITPAMFPAPFSESAFGSEKFLSYDCFYGFLYYEPVTGRTIADRAGRALEIIENTFNIQLFMTDTFDEDFFYPFYGFYPDWNDLFSIILNNAPQDGYWGAIDSDRLLSEDYISQKHISSYILMMDSVDTLADGFNFPEGFEKFEIDQITTSFADISEISNVFSSVFDLLNFSSGVFSMFDATQMLSGDSKFITSIIQYEGAEEGIYHVGEKYQFDLMKALDYDVTEKGPLAPSKKVYIALIGALLSEIDISIYSSDILSFTPLYYPFSTYILDSISEAAFLLGQSLDLSIIENISLRTFWRTDNVVNRIVTNLYDHANLENPLNLLSTLSLTGLPLIPTGILDPIDDFTIEYAVNSTEPTLRVEKDYQFSSYESGDYELDITVTNVGNVSAWGRKIEFSVLNQTFLPIPEIITDFISQQYNMTVEEFLIPEEPPRFLFLDSFGSGIPDYVYPEITNFTQLTFYNPQFASDIMDPANDEFFNSSGVTQEEREIFAELFNQSSSIFNPDNWKLDPGESFTYTISDLSIGPLYDYSNFYNLDFTITEDGLEPYLSYGYTITPSEPINATTDDGSSWNINSEQIGDDHIIQVFFSFQNTSIIDFYNHSLDQVGINCSFTSTDELSMDTQFTLEFFNTTSLTFELIPNDSYTATNTLIEYTTPANLMDYIDPPNNYRCIFKLTFTTNFAHILSIDKIKAQFYDRDLDTILQSPAVVAYSTYAGYNTYFISSNPVPSVTDPAPILVATAELAHYNSVPGQMNRYNLTIENIGDLCADDVNITLKAPGIVADAGNFSLVNGYLYYNISSIDVGFVLQNLSFSFYSPNSLILPDADIDYNHPITPLNSTNPDFTTLPNDLFLSAPIDYTDAAHSPFLYVLEFFYESNYTNANISGGIAPQEGDIIKLDLIVENFGPITLSDLNCTIPNNVIGLERTDNSTAEFVNIINGTTQSFFTNLNKTHWDSFIFPGVDAFNSSQKYTIQIIRKCPLILAYKDFLVQKTFSDYDGVHNSIVTVQINVTNTGNLHVYDLDMHDFGGAPKEGFLLASGTPDKHIASLAPGETFTYFYTLKLIKQGKYEILPASLDYDYISQRTACSETLIVKVRNNWVVNALYVLIPSIISGLATGLIFWSKKRYDVEAAEFSRREELMFGQDLRSISWNRRTFQEDLLDLSNSEKIQENQGVDS